MEELLFDHQRLGLYLKKLSENVNGSGCQDLAYSTTSTNDNNNNNQNKNYLSSLDGGNFYFYRSKEEFLEKALSIIKRYGRISMVNLASLLFLPISSGSSGDQDGLPKMSFIPTTDVESLVANGDGIHWLEQGQIFIHDKYLSLLSHYLESLLLANHQSTTNDYIAPLADFAKAFEIPLDMAISKILPSLLENDKIIYDESEGILFSTYVEGYYHRRIAKLLDFISSPISFSRLSDLHGIRGYFLKSFSRSGIAVGGHFVVSNPNGTVIFVPEKFHRQQVDAIALMWNNQGYLDTAFCTSNFQFFDESIRTWMLKNKIINSLSDIAFEKRPFIISSKVMAQIEAVFEDVNSSKTWNLVEPYIPAGLVSTIGQDICAYCLKKFPDVRLVKGGAFVVSKELVASLKQAVWIATDELVDIKIKENVTLESIRKSSESSLDANGSKVVVLVLDEIPKKGILAEENIDPELLDLLYKSDWESELKLYHSKKYEDCYNAKYDELKKVLALSSSSSSSVVVAAAAAASSQEQQQSLSTKSSKADAKPDSDFAFTRSTSYALPGTSEVVLFVTKLQRLLVELVVHEESLQLLESKLSGSESGSDSCLKLRKNLIKTLAEDKIQPLLYTEGASLYKDTFTVPDAAVLKQVLKERNLLLWNEKISSCLTNKHGFDASIYAQEFKTKYANALLNTVINGKEPALLLHSLVLYLFSKNLLATISASGKFVPILLDLYQVLVPEDENIKDMRLILGYVLPGQNDGGSENREPLSDILERVKGRFNNKP